jgi:MFS family permease
VNTSINRSSWYPWFIAFMALLVLFVSNGYTATALSVFDESLLKEFGWERGPFKFRDLLSFAITAVVAPFIGVIIDRVSPKWLIIIGMFLLSAGYLGYGQLTPDGSGGLATPLALVALAGLIVMAVVIWRTAQDRWVRIGAALALALVAYGVARYRFIEPDALHQVYIIHVVFSLALSTAGSMVVLVLVTSWFLQHRGLAIGIALLGTSLGGIVLSRVNIQLIESLGWRESFAYLAFGPLIVAALTALFVRGSPKDAGVVAVGQSTGDKDLRQYGLTFDEAIRTRTFWAIGASGFLTYYSILALFNHLFLHMRGLEFDPKQSVYALQLLGAVAAFSKLAVGALADYMDRRLVFLASLAVMFVGVLMLAMGGRDLIWVSIAITGLGWGGLFTLYNMLTVNNFGLREIGRINGSVSFMESLGGGLGIWLTGVLYDQFGSYEIPFDVIAAGVFLGFFIGLAIKSGSPEAMGLKPSAQPSR